MATNTIAIFDFDKTLTVKDTLLSFLRFSFGKKKLFGSLIIFLPVFISFLFGFISRQKVKEKYLYHFLKKIKLNDFHQLCMNYSIEINNIVNPIAIKKLLWHQQNKHTTIIVSASIENWILPWAEKYNFDKVIATKINIENGKITENFFTKNCYGQEKVTRLLEEFPNIDTYEIYTYGDSYGDKDLLALATHKFFKCF